MCVLCLGSFFPFCMWMSSCSNTICKKISWVYCLLLLLCERSVDYTYVSLFLASILFYNYICLFFHQYHCLDSNSFILSLDVQKYQPSKFVLLQCCVDYSGSFASASQFSQNNLLGFFWSCIESIYQFGKNWHFETVVSSYP